MARRLKLLTGLSTIAITSALALSACGGGAEGESDAAKTDTPADPFEQTDHSSHGGPASAESEGEGKGKSGGEGEGEGASGGEGEGEGGGEGEGAGSADPATDDVAYLTQLALVRGHLKAFVELYHAGANDHASMHVKHPESELYAGLVPAFTARGTDGFAGELTALVNANQAKSGVDEAYANARAAIESEYPTISTKKGILAIAALTKIAADEYDIAVEDDGSIVNLHEYQDAYGFLSVAKEILDGASPSTAEETSAVSQSLGQVEALLAQFDGWTPASVKMKPSALYGAAARIEIEAKGL